MPGYVVTLIATSIHYGIVGYKEHMALLKKDGLLRIGKK
jgi:hypothetical protein